MRQHQQRVPRRDAAQRHEPDQRRHRQRRARQPHRRHAPTSASGMFSITCSVSRSERRCRTGPRTPGQRQQRQQRDVRASPPAGLELARHGDGHPLWQRPQRVERAVDVLHRAAQVPPRDVGHDDDAPLTVVVVDEVRPVSPPPPRPARPDHVPVLEDERDLPHPVDASRASGASRTSDVEAPATVQHLAHLAAAERLLEVRASCPAAPRTAAPARGRCARGPAGSAPAAPPGGRRCPAIPASRPLRPRPCPQRVQVLPEQLDRDLRPHPRQQVVQPVARSAAPR